MSQLNGREEREEEGGVEWKGKRENKEGGREKRPAEEQEILCRVLIY